MMFWWHVPIQSSLIEIYRWTLSQKFQITGTVSFTLRWCHHGRDSISNHQPHDWLFNLLFRCRSKKTSMLRVTGLCAGNSPVTGELHKWPVTRKMFPFDDVIIFCIKDDMISHNWEPCIYYTWAYIFSYLIWHIDHREHQHIWSPCRVSIKNNYLINQYLVQTDTRTWTHPQWLYLSGIHLIFNLHNVA